MIKTQSFHIPVMGLGFTIDTPLKVSQYGIDSVISLGDDILLERLRKLFCEKNKIEYTEISDKMDDFRAKRISSYLNLINDLAVRKFEEIKSSISQKGTEVKEYINELPYSTVFKSEIENLSIKRLSLGEIKDWIKEHIKMGSIDVNIMTKVDKDNYLKKEKLPREYNDAHAALRGFANSKLNSSVVLSAGLNPRLYGYFDQFEDFYHDKNGNVKKKIILKVSDYRSALIQGKFFAKKGLWVSEYRIESGLNCGGHAFATDGFLMGPILSEFDNNKEELIGSIHDILIKALASKNRQIPLKKLPLKITAQGGVGTAEEHQFLINHYKVDSVGWGSPFLLVPEVVNLDDNTLDQLREAKVEDLYLSNISPLGIPFNSLKNNTKDLEKMALIKKGRPGSSCPKKFLALNNEFSEKTICPASRQYQHLKLKELDKENLSKEQYQRKFNQITEKACICTGLGTSALIVNDMNTKVEGVGVSVCPGPNLAYFSKIMSLADITNHIYGRINIMTNDERPNMFIKELRLYINYLQDLFEDAVVNTTKKQKNYLLKFTENLTDGIRYYQQMFSGLKNDFCDTKIIILDELDLSLENLKGLKLKMEMLTIE